MAQSGKPSWSEAQHHTYFNSLGVFFFSLPVTGLGIWGMVEKAVLSIHDSPRRSGYISFMHGRMEQREMNYLIYAYDRGVAA